MTTVDPSEARLRASIVEGERWYRALFEHSDTIQLLLDPTSRAIIDVNGAAERFYGWSREAMRRMQRAAIESSDRHRRHTHRLANGEQRRVHLIEGTVEIDGRGATHLVVEELSDLARAEDDVRAIEEQLRANPSLVTAGKLAGGIAHDFNNLLTVIRGAAGFLREAITDDPTAVDDIATIERATDRAEELTRQLLAFARAYPPVE